MRRKTSRQSKDRRDSDKIIQKNSFKEEKLNFLELIKPFLINSFIFFFSTFLILFFNNFFKFEKSNFSKHYLSIISTFSNFLEKYFFKYFYFFIFYIIFLFINKY